MARYERAKTVLKIFLKRVCLHFEPHALTEQKDKNMFLGLQTAHS